MPSRPCDSPMFPIARICGLCPVAEPAESFGSSGWSVDELKIRTSLSAGTPLDSRLARNVSEMTTMRSADA